MAERWKPSVTVAAIASREHAGRVEYLLVEERTADGLRLNNPAGHLEPGESFVQAVGREALEETTRRFVAERLVGVYLARLARPGNSGKGGSTGDDSSGDDDDITYVRFAFAGSIGAADPARHLDRGIVRTLWLTLDDVRASRDRHRSPLVLRCIEDAAAGRSFALDALVVDDSVLGAFTADGDAAEARAADTAEPPPAPA